MKNETAKKANKSIAIFLAILLFSLSFCLTAYATETTAVLTKDMTVAYSGTLTGYSVKYRGSNNSDSGKSVYFIVKKKTSSTVYSTYYKELMEPGYSFKYIESDNLTKNYTWRITLNPKGANTSGCIAHGRMAKTS